MTLTDFVPDPGTDIGSACNRACELVRTLEGPVKMEFNGTEVIAMSGMTPDDLYATWYSKRKADRETSNRPIIAELQAALIFLQQNRRYRHAEDALTREIGSLSE